jgi:hypothetical protein
MEIKAERSATFYQTTQRNIPEGLNLQQHQCKNIKPQKPKFKLRPALHSTQNNKGDHSQQQQNIFVKIYF